MCDLEGNLQVAVFHEPTGFVLLGDKGHKFESCCWSSLGGWVIAVHFADSTYSSHCMLLWMVWMFRVVMWSQSSDCLIIIHLQFSLAVSQPATLFCLLESTVTCPMNRGRWIFERIHLLDYLKYIPSIVHTVNYIYIFFKNIILAKGMIHINLESTIKSEAIQMLICNDPWKL